MRTVVLGPRPPELEADLQRRRALGQDLYDEVWAGECHLSPAPSGPHAVVDGELAVALHPLARRAGLVGSGPFNLGRAGDYRVPDRGLHREVPRGVYAPTAAMVVEIVSPDDETFEKFAFYAAQGVEEILVADPKTRSVRLWRLESGRYDERPRSELLGVSAADLARAIDWP